MAQSITLTSGSVFNGNPITFAVKPSVISNPVMHRVVVEVLCGFNLQTLDVVKMSMSVIDENGTPIDIDISSALRALRDSYVYMYAPTEYPVVFFNLTAYDEYLKDGNTHTTNKVYFPAKPDLADNSTFYRTIFGGFSDIERITSPVFKGVTSLSMKPVTSPQLVVKGEPFAYTPPYATEQTLANSPQLLAPQSKVVTVSKEGAQTLGYQSVYALPSTSAKDRQQFRFINRYGVLESISVPRASTKNNSVMTEQYTISRPETLNTFSRMLVRKQPDRESWQFSTDPLDEDWLSWYLHEFLMAEYIWMYVSSPQGSESTGVWLRCHISPDEETSFYDRTKTHFYAVTFTVLLDINGIL